MPAVGAIDDALGAFAIGWKQRQVLAGGADEHALGFLTSNGVAHQLAVQDGVVFARVGDDAAVWHSTTEAQKAVAELQSTLSRAGLARYKGVGPEDVPQNLRLPRQYGEVVTDADNLAVVVPDLEKTAAGHPWRTGVLHGRVRDFPEGEALREVAQRYLKEAFAKGEPSSLAAWST